MPTIPEQLKGCFLMTNANKKGVRTFTLAFGAAALLLGAFVLLSGGGWGGSLAKATEGPLLRAEPLARWGLWWAALWNAILCAVLAATSRWWIGISESSSAGEALPPIKRNRWLWLLVILAAAGSLRWARMDLSLYNDEAQTFRRCISGQYRATKQDGSIKWRQVTWWDTLWLNRSANNSTPFSILERASYDTWKKFAKAAPGAVNETALRLPSLLGGMASLWLLWLLGRRLWPGSGLCWWLIVLAALHPWHIRYSTEARGYGLLLGAVSLCLYALCRATGEKRWRWWLILGVSEFLCVWIFPGAVYLLVTLNFLLLCRQSWQWKTGRESASAVVRPVVAMVLGGMLTIQLMLPLVPQLTNAMDTIPALHAKMGLTWWSDAIAGLFSGARWVDQATANPFNPALTRHLMAGGPQAWLLGSGLAVLLVTLLIGLVVLCQRNKPIFLAVLAAFAAVVLGWALMSRRGIYLHCWYVIYALPAVLIAGGAGMAWIFTRVKSLPLRIPALCAALLPLLCWLKIDLIYAEHSKEDIRGVVEASLGTHKPGNSKPLLGDALGDSDIYDPSIVALRSLEDLETLIARARSEKRDLYVSLAHRSGDPGWLALFQRVETKADFEFVKVFHGLEEDQFTHYLYRLKPAP